MIDGDADLLCTLEIGKLLLLVADKGCLGRNTITASEAVYELSHLQLSLELAMPILKGMVSHGLLATVDNYIFTVTPQGRQAID